MAGLKLYADRVVGFVVSLGEPIILILAIIFLTLASAWLYRAGGQGAPYNTKWRDLGCPACAIATLMVLGFFHWSMIFVFFLDALALSTYNKWLGRIIFNRPKSDVFWEGWMMTGFFYSVAALPLVMVYNLWFGFFLRTITLVSLTALWSEFISNDVWEERGRGFLHNATLPLLIL